MPLPASPLPDFTSSRFLRAHVEDTLAFYRPVAFDPDGGFFHCFRDDGSVYERGHRHLVSASRFVFNWANAHRLHGGAPWRDWAAHALAQLERDFRTPAGDYVWTTCDRRVEDGRIMAYGQAFVLLAKSHAHRIGLCDAAAVRQVFDRMDAVFFEPASGA